MPRTVPFVADAGRPEHVSCIAGLAREQRLSAPFVRTDLSGDVGPRSRILLGELPDAGIAAL